MAVKATGGPPAVTFALAGVMLRVGPPLLVDLQASAKSNDAPAIAMGVFIWTSGLKSPLAGRSELVPMPWDGNLHGVRP